MRLKSWGSDYLKRLSQVFQIVIMVVPFQQGKTRPYTLPPVADGGQRQNSDVNVNVISHEAHD